VTPVVLGALLGILGASLLLSCSEGQASQTPEDSSVAPDSTPEGDDAGPRLRDTGPGTIDASGQSDTVDAGQRRDLAGGCVECAGTNVVEFSDPNFEVVARRAAGVPEGCPFCLAYLDAVTLIDGEGASIASIDGIEHFHDLEAVLLHFNQIEDISPLGRLPVLAHVKISENPLASVSGLEASTTITSFVARECPIADIEFLRSNVKLTLLELHGAQTESVDWLEGFDELRTLCVDASALATTRGIAHLPALYSLSLRGNELTSLEGLTDLPNLEILHATGNEIADAGPVVDLPALREVLLDWNEISDLSALAAKEWAPGSVLNVVGNPIDCAEQAENIMELKVKLSVFESDCP